MDNDTPRTRHLAKRTFLHRSIPRYQEYFDDQMYLDVINDKNRDTVAKIDALVESINELRENKILEHDRLDSLEKELLALILGLPQA